MRSCWMAALLAGVLAAACVGPGDPGTASPASPNTSSAESFMWAYAATWNMHDAKTLAVEFYALGRSVQDQEAATARTFVDLVAQGYTKSKIHKITACMMGADTAWAGMRFSRLDREGVPMPPPERASSYDLTWVADRGWRISRMGSADASQPLKCPDQD